MKEIPTIDISKDYVYEEDQVYHFMRTNPTVWLFVGTHTDFEDYEAKLGFLIENGWRILLWGNKK